MSQRVSVLNCLQVQPWFRSCGHSLDCQRVLLYIGYPGTNFATALRVSRRTHHQHSNYRALIFSTAATPKKLAPGHSAKLTTPWTSGHTKLLFKQPPNRTQNTPRCSHSHFPAQLIVLILERRNWRSQHSKSPPRAPQCASLSLPQV